MPAEPDVARDGASIRSVRSAGARREHPVSTEIDDVRGRIDLRRRVLQLESKTARLEAVVNALIEGQAEPAAVAPIAAADAIAEADAIAAARDPQLDADARLRAQLKVALLEWGKLELELTRERAERERLGRALSELEAAAGSGRPPGGAE